MKKLLCLLFASIILTSCTAKIPPQDYCNTEEGCMLGNTHYSNPDTFGIQVWNPAWDAPYMGLCRDPLCTHDSKDSLCPSSVYMQMSFQSVVTDGYQLYLNTGNDLLYKNGASFRQIYSLNPDGSEFKLLHTFSVTANTPPGLQYADGYLYFKQGVFNESYDPQNGDPAGDQIMQIMRIPVSGGDAETVLDGQSDTNRTLYVDGEHYYLVSAAGTNRPVIDVVDIDTGKVTGDVLPGLDSGACNITVYSGKTWLVHTFASDNTDQFDPMGDLYVWRDGRFELICDDKFDYSFGGGIWYKERAERTYIGTVDAPTGGPRDETVPVDLYIEPTTKLCRLAPADFSITEYTPSSDFDPEDTIHITSTDESGIRAHISNSRKRLAGEADSYDCFIRCEDGYVSIEKIYE